MTRTTTRVLSVALAAVVAMATFSLYTFQAAAYNNHRGGNDGDSTSVSTNNSATISNNVDVDAKTGGNEAEGGDGGRGGDGGDASRGTAGAGGNGGRGGDGGTVTSGDATALGTIYNDVNYTRVVVEGCGCDDDSAPAGPMLFMQKYFDYDEDGNVIRVSTRNSATVSNDLDVDAKTGYNEADGGEGGNGDDGGDARSRTHHSWNLWFNWFNPTPASVGGEGSNGGAAGHGGTIRTGAADATGGLTNLVNTTVVRVLNGDDEEEAPAS